MTSDLPLSLQRDLFRQKNLTLDNIKQGQLMDAGTVQRFLNIATTWPTIRPGASLAFARAGFDGSSPQMQSLARLGIKQNQNLALWQDHLTQSSAGANDLFAPDTSTPTSDTSQPVSDAAAPASSAGSHNASLKNVPTDKLVNLYQQVGTDQTKALNGQLSAKAYEKRWGADPEDGSAHAALVDALTYELGSRDQSQVKTLLGSSGPTYTDVNNKKIDAYQQFQTTFAKVKDQQGIAQASAAVDQSLPSQVAKFATRQVSTVANAGLQYVQGAIRNEAGGGTVLFNASGQPTTEQTDLGQQITHGLDTGDGFLPSPDAPAGQAALAVQRQSAPLVGGHAFTLGRGVASLAFDPNTQPFNVASGIVDGLVAYKADPSAALLTHYGDLREGTHLLNNTTDEAGRLITTSGNMVSPVGVSDYYAGDSFTKRANTAMDISQGNAGAMWRLLNQGTERTSSAFPVIGTDGTPIIQKLADAADTNEFRDVMQGASDIKSIVPAPGVGYHVRRITADVRALHDMPPSSVATPFDLNTNIKTMDDVMAGANVPEATRNVILDKAIRNPDPLAGWDLVHDSLVQSVMAHNPSMSERDARAIAAPFTTSPLINRAFDIDQATNAERITDGTVIAGESKAIPHPVFDGQVVGTIIPMPDPRELRQLTSNAAWMTGSKPWKVTTTALAAPTYLFRLAAVASGRIALRSITESQLNAASRGFMTTLAHPLTAIGATIADHPDSGLGALIEKLGVKPAYATDFAGDKFTTTADELMMHSAGLVQTPDTIATGGWVDVPITHKDAGFGLADQINKLHSDPVMKGIADAGGVQEAKDWFWNEARAIREGRQPRLTTQDNWGMAHAASSPQISFTPIGDIVNDRARADNYIENVLYPALMDTTGNGDEELMQAVRDGKLNGRRIASVPNGDGTAINQGAQDYAKSMLEQGRGPKNSVLLREEIANPKSASEIARSTQIYKHVVDTFFHWFVDVPEKVLNRNFTYRQMYYQEGIENLAHASPDAYDKFLANAEAANISDAQLNQIRNVKLVNDPEHQLNIDQLDYLAKANAAHGAAKMFHDLGARSQFFDQARFIIPFGDAFRLIAQRMYNLVKDEPQVLRRLQQGAQEAKQPGSGTINRLLGDPLPKDQGFFHTDPATNEQTWMVPGSTFLDSSVLGIPIPLQGQVKGLNMLADGYPGLGGPALGLPAKWFLGDSPTEQSIKQVLYPYGGSSSQGIAQDLGSIVLPSYLQKVAEGAVDQKAYSSTFNDVVNTLQSTQKYQLFSGTPDERKNELLRLVNDAKDKTRELYMIRGAAQFFLPGMTTPAFQTEDKNGHLQATAILTKQYAAIAYDGKKYEGETGQDAAMKWLINTKGVDSMFVAQPNSAPNAYAIPQSASGQAWVANHPDVKDKLPLTYGFFAPADKTRSLDAYNESFNNGGRRVLSPLEQAAQAENRLGFYAYDTKRQQILDANKGKNLTSAQSDWLRKYRAQLQDAFPGFDSYSASPFDTQKKRATAVRELQSATRDPELSGTPAGQGLTAYLAVRDVAMQAATKAGLASPFQAKKAANLRSWLQDAGDKIASRYPEFRPIWEQVFAYEFPQASASAPAKKAGAPVTTTAPSQGVFAP